MQSIICVPVFDELSMSNLFYAALLVMQQTSIIYWHTAITSAYIFIDSP
jgi:hypothetical protein